MTNRAFLALFAVLVLIFAAAVSTGVWLAGRSTESDSANLIGGPFELVDHTGQTVTEQDYADKIKVIYFGYTFCPDICPTGLTAISTALDQLGADAEGVAALFITIDPERDTVAEMSVYREHFHERFRFLTGTPVQIAEVARGYRVYYQKVEPDGASDYLMDHSTVTYLMGRNGSYLTHFGHEMNPERLAEEIRKAL